MATPTIQAAYYRGGTSKALLFHPQHLPPPGPDRDAVLKRLMSAPHDPMQIDGMGGTHIVTSKVAIIGPSSRPGVDVDYTFGQVSVGENHIDYSGNCGNISAAVGPFAITEGLVKERKEGSSPAEGVETQLVRIYVTGTGKIMEEHVPVDERGVVVTKGDFAIDGCPGTGAPILIDMKGTIGGACGKGVMPSGNVVDVMEVKRREVEYSVCDVGNIIVFARAKDFGIRGNEAPAALDENMDLLDQIRELRGKVAQKLGLVDRWQDIDHHGPLPMTALVSPATNNKGHIQSRLFLDNKCHTAMAGTGAVCHAGCSRVKGSIVHQMLTAGTEGEPVLSIQHPCGLMPAAVALKEAEDGAIPEYETLSFVRTARRIFKGELDVPDDIRHLGGDVAQSKGTAQTNGTCVREQAAPVAVNGHMHTNGHIKATTNNAARVNGS